MVHINNNEMISQRPSKVVVIVCIYYMCMEDIIAETENITKNMFNLKILNNLLL